MFIENTRSDILSKKILIFALIGVALFVFTFFTFQEVRSVDFPFTLDPPYHMTFAQAMDQNKPFSTSLSTYDGGVITTKYATLLRVFTVAIHEITGLSYVFIFQVFGIFTRLLSAIIIFLVGRKLIKDDFIALIGMTLFLGANYVIFRGIITFPENLVIPFHLLIFYEIIKTFNNKKISYLLPIYLAGAALVHYRSMVVPTILVAFLIAYIVWGGYQKYKLNKNVQTITIRNILLVASIFIILSLPVLIDTFKTFSVYYNGNVGFSATFAESVTGSARYIPPSFSTYLGNFGYLLVIFTLFGFVVMLLKKKKNKSDWLLLIWLFFTLLLSQGTRLQLYVPTDRMLIYLILPSVVVSLFALKYIYENLKKSNFLLSLFFISSLILLSVTASNVNGWKAFDNYEIHQVEWLNSNISFVNNDVLLTSGVKYKNLGFNQFDLLETRSEPLTKIFVDGSINNEEIKNIYSGKHVYLAVNYDNSSLSRLLNIGTSFSDGNCIVYDLGVQ